MDIKLKAKLSTYSVVDNIEDIDDDHVCPSVQPVTKEQIDDLFNKNSHSDVTSYKAFTAFVDSLFAGDDDV